MEQQTFADGIGRIAIIDGIVLLDLVANSPTEAGPDGKPLPVFSHRVVMGVDLFPRAAKKIAKTVNVINTTAIATSSGTMRRRTRPPPPPSADRPAWSAPRC